LIEGQGMPMTPVMAASEHNVPACPADVLSPELALVDPFLRAAAQQEQIADVADRLPRMVSTAAPPPTIGHDRFITLARAVEAADWSEPSSRDRRSRSWRLVAAVASVTILGLLLVDVRVRLERTPVAGRTSAIGMSGVGDAPTVQDARPLRSPTTEIRGGSQSRRFAWAPIDNASGYHVEFFRGPLRVLARNTSESQITIPAHWRLDRRRESLVPGDYRWYVWPIMSGRRAARAIVQAQLVVR
jgi:hypothetical protein